MKKVVLILLTGLSSLLLIGGCDVDSGPQTSRSGATEIGQLYHVQKNAQGNTSEQQNIFDRIKVTTDLTKVMWIHLIALDGKIIRRMAVRNKITSSGKRLEARHFFPNKSDYTTPPTSGGLYTDELIQPDGTYGESDAYVYWFDPQHRYHQYGTAGGIGYLLTDYPIDLHNPIDEITGMYNLDKIAGAWQEEQEKKLKAQEGRR